MPGLHEQHVRGVDYRVLGQLEANTAVVRILKKKKKKKKTLVGLASKHCQIIRCPSEAIKRFTERGVYEIFNIPQW
jgi:hypothetical protein